LLPHASRLGEAQSV
jgi:hypothetical protein